MNWRILLFIPALALGVGVFLFINNRAPDPLTSDGARPLVPVRVTTVTPEPVTVTVTGYGRVEPVRTWEAISRVDGQIIETIPDLAIGAFVDQGETILRVDPRDYEIARDRANANLAIAQAQLAELIAQEGNTAQQLALEQQIEQVAQNEVDRRASLVERGTTAQASLEQAQRDLITQQRRVLDLANQLALFPVQRESAEATVESSMVDVEQAERDLSNTVVTAPFSGRILEESASEGVYVRTGDPLVSIASIETAEVVAEIQPAAMSDALSVLIPSVDSIAHQVNLFEEDAAIQALDAAGIGATMVLSQGQDHSYAAEIVRLDGSVDSATGTLGIVVRVSGAGLPDPQTRRPPLTNGAFVSVLFQGSTAAPNVIVPRDALIDGQDGPYVYVVDSNSRLTRRSVSVIGRTGGDMVISDGLTSGDKLVLTPPEPAILGTFLAPIHEHDPATLVTEADDT